MSNRSVDINGYFGSTIEKYERRVKKIGKAPTPGKLKSNLNIYLAELHHRQKQLEAWEAGEPFSTGFPHTLHRALGFHFYDSEMAADRFERALVEKCTAWCRQDGLPQQVCDRTVLNRAVITHGLYPMLAFIGGAGNFECENMGLTNLYLSWMENIPMYYVDVPYEDTYESIHYVAEQLEEMIDFAERSVPGIKFSKGRLIELQEIERQWHLLYQEFHEYRRRKPCPVPSDETFKEPRWPSLYEDPYEYLEAFRAYVNEIKERAEAGVSAVPEEKLRIIWVTSAPFYARPTPWFILEKRGVVVVYYQVGTTARQCGIKGGGGIYGDEIMYGRKLTPLEEEARWMNGNSWAGLGQRWIDATLNACRDVGAEAIVYWTPWGCTLTQNQGKLITDAAERELGIPTLEMSGRMLIDDNFDQRKMEDDLNNFVDVCFARKGI